MPLTLFAHHTYSYQWSVKYYPDQWFELPSKGTIQWRSQYEVTNMGAVSETISGFPQHLESVAILSEMKRTARSQHVTVKWRRVTTGKIKRKRKMGIFYNLSFALSIKGKAKLLETVSAFIIDPTLFKPSTSSTSYAMLQLTAITHTRQYIILLIWEVGEIQPTTHGFVSTVEGFVWSSYVSLNVHYVNAWIRLPQEACPHFSLCMVYFRWILFSVLLLLFFVAFHRVTVDTISKQAKQGRGKSQQGNRWISVHWSPFKNCDFRHSEIFPGPFSVSSRAESF